MTPRTLPAAKLAADPARLFGFLAAKAKASEANPLRLGNVEFWHPVPGFDAGLCWSIPTHQWDIPAVSADANRLAGPVWDELCAHLMQPTGTTP